MAVALIRWVKHNPVTACKHRSGIQYRFETFLHPSLLIVLYTCKTSGTNLKSCDEKISLFYFIYLFIFFFFNIYIRIFFFYWSIFQPIDEGDFLLLQWLRILEIEWDRASIWRSSILIDPSSDKCIRRPLGGMDRSMLLSLIGEKYRLIDWARIVNTFICWPPLRAEILISRQFIRSLLLRFFFLWLFFFWKETVENSFFPFFSVGWDFESLSQLLNS